MLVKEPAEYPEPDQDDTLRETLVPEVRTENAPPSAPPPQKAVPILSSSWPGLSFEVVADEVFCG